MRSVLRSLTVLQHLLVLVLCAVCLGRAFGAATSGPPLVAAMTLFLAWYVAGIVLAHRTDVGLSEAVTAESTSGAAVAWLLGLTAWWLLLVALSPENVWIAFSLWLLGGHLLRWREAIPYALFALFVVVAAPWRATGTMSFPQVIGPSVGALFALVISQAQATLVRVAYDRQRLVTSLVAAQGEADILHAELAEAQREAGVLSERARLSRDIHDTLAQGFSSIVILARSGHVATGVEDLRRLLVDIEVTASDNLVEARRVVGALAPRDLDAGLPAALRRLLQRFEHETAVATDLRLDGEFDGLPTAVEVALVRTAQGALANVRRHAAARQVVVTLADAEDSVRLDVVDDGVGFVPGSSPDLPRSTSEGGYGLPSTRARLRELGGGLDIESAPGEGTALSAYLPLRGGGR